LNNKLVVEEHIVQALLNSLP